MRRKTRATVSTTDASASTPTTDASASASILRAIPVTEIATDGSNPRTLFDQGGEAGLEELAASIKAHGLVQPITVRPNPDGAPPFLLVAGERRLRAVRDVLKGTTIMAIVRHDLAADTAFEATVLENLQRRDLHPMEDARGLNRLRVTYGYTPAMIAAKTGRGKAWVKDRLKLCDLPVAVQDVYLGAPRGRMTLEALLTLHDYTHGGRDNKGFPDLMTALADELGAGRASNVALGAIAGPRPDLVMNIRHAYHDDRGRWAGNYFDTRSICTKCPFAAYREGYYDGVGYCLLPTHYQELQQKGAATYDRAEAEAAKVAPDAAPGRAAPGGAMWQPEPVKSAAEKGKETRQRHKDQKAAYAPNVAAIERTIDMIPAVDGVDVAVLCAYVLTSAHVHHAAVQHVMRRHGLTSFPGPESTPTKGQIERLREIEAVSLVRYTLEALLLTQAERARDDDPGKMHADPVLSLYLPGHAVSETGAA